MTNIQLVHVVIALVPVNEKHGTEQPWTGILGIFNSPEAAQQAASQSEMQSWICRMPVDKTMKDFVVHLQAAHSQGLQTGNERFPEDRCFDVPPNLWED